MKQVVIISGKGGTGKTIFTASLAALASSKVMVDCDVDAADLHLLLNPRIVERHEFRSGKTAWIDPALCIACGNCAEVCRFEAIDEGGDDFVVDPLSCEGCGLCPRICPAEAIEMRENLCGEWYISETAYGPFVHAKLGIAQENSGKLVACVREAAKKIAQSCSLDYVIIDGSPGIGCPVLASLTDTNLAVIVTEPTVSGIHDLLRIVDLTRHFQIPAGVVINKFDLNRSNSEEIKRFCDSGGIEVMGEIPFSMEVPRSLVKGVPFVEFSQDTVADEMTSIWNKVASALADDREG